MWIAKRPTFDCVSKNPDVEREKLVKISITWEEEVGGDIVKNSEAGRKNQNMIRYRKDNGLARKAANFIMNLEPV
ncbi:unnamed protein product [Linum trigynum]|uniref:Uncharacterized protein n=1 Tax=Linum trigynum TaxID=586398 RepID=A0AAV2F9H7_9ROSI